MKTPRELLLEQNRDHDRRLNEIQRAIIASTVAQVSKPAVSPISQSACRQMFDGRQVIQMVLSDLILPARRIWLSYAFVWLAIAAFHLATADHTTPQIANTANTSEAIANWKEQQIILTELTKQPEHEPVDRPKPQPISPRSEANPIVMG